MKSNPVKPVLGDPEVIEYLQQLHRHFVIVPIDKAANNFSFICKKYYISKILHEVGLSGTPNPTYTLTTTSKTEIIDNNIRFCEKFGLKVNDKQRDLPIMYWLPKMHKNPVGFRFIIASKNCSTKPLTKVVSKYFQNNI